MTTTCQKCRKAPAVVNLGSARTVDGKPGPNLWICAACFSEGINSPEARELAQADEEADDHRRGGGSVQ